MNAIRLRATRCAICGTAGNAEELYPARFDADALTPEVFSARRLPDRIHFRLVTCRTCGLVRSDPAVPVQDLAQLYAGSTTTYPDEIGDLRRTYGHYLRRLDDLGARKGTLLEIGCGNGFFLEEALDLGYRTVRGVEPSRASVEQAGPRVRDGIVCGLMGPGLFEPGSVDVICLFQTLDHLPDPGALLDECFRLLRPGGLMLCINHNVEAVSARLLRSRSPIIDIEHTYLYSPATMARLFRAHGFTINRQRVAWNRYSIRYLCRLVPAPGAIKRRLLPWLQQSRFGRPRLWVPLGNLLLVARRPAEPSARGAEP